MGQFSSDRIEYVFFPPFFFFVITNITYFNLEMKGNSLWHYLRSCLLALPFVSVVRFTCKENHEPRLIIWFSSSLNCSKIWESGGHTYLRTWRQIEFLKSSNSSTSSIWPSFKKVRENGLGLKFLFPLVGGLRTLSSHPDRRCRSTLWVLSLDLERQGCFAFFLFEITSKLQF